MSARRKTGEVSPVIVKDRSRFGRNYIGSGQYTEILYASPGVRFIVIQENVDTVNNTGTERMPISNTFNRKTAVHGNEKTHCHNGVMTDICFTAVGMMILPDEQAL